MISSVIWVSDLRDSTRLADTLQMPEYLDFLNGYFEYAAEADGPRGAGSGA